MNPMDSHDSHVCYALAVVEAPLEFISIAEASRLTGVSAWHLNRARKAGKIGTYRPGVRPMLRWSEVQAWIETTREAMSCDSSS